MERLIELMESRIRRNVYVRFGGEHLKTYHSNMERRWVLSLRTRLLFSRAGRGLCCPISVWGRIVDVHGQLSLHCCPGLRRTELTACRIRSERCGDSYSCPGNRQRSARIASADTLPYGLCPSELFRRVRSVFAP